MKTKGHLTLIRCDQLPDPEQPAKRSSVLDSESVYFREDRVTVHDFTTSCGPSGYDATPTALITVFGGEGSGMTISAKVDYEAMTKLRDVLTNVLDHYEEVWT